MTYFSIDQNLRALKKIKTYRWKEAFPTSIDSKFQLIPTYHDNSYYTSQYKNIKTRLKTGYES
jgi:hypothetical protein